ncbi:nitric oxide reductase activation protein NorD [Mycobacterium arosiense]|nr:VWA domain-containing protein [Mycobacterium arosiense]
MTARFGLLGAAIAGRPMTIACTSGPAWTDGRTIYACPNADTARQIVAQAALIAAGSLRPDVIRALIGRAQLSRRYLSLEGRRALEALGDLRPAWASDGVDLDGAAAALDSPSAAMRVARSRARVAAPPDWFGVVKPARLIGRANVSLAAATPQPVVDLRAEDEEAADEDSERSLASKMSNFLGDNPIARALRKQLGMTAASSDPSAGGEPGSWTRTLGRLTRGGVTVAMPGDADEAAPALDGPRVNLYPEWDGHRRCYRPAWCRVIEDVARPQELSSTQRSARHDTLRRMLAPLGLGLRRQRRQFGGQDFDIDSVIDARVAMVVGNTPPEAVYVDNLRRRRELGVLVLLDASGSANEVDPAGDQLHRRQQDAAAALIDTLSILGDRVSGYAFRSRGREVIFTRIKGFDEPFESLQLARLDAVQPDGFTRLGAAIRHAATLVATDRAMLHRLLIIISDGFAYDAGYEGSYAEADACRAVAEARARGIGCVCINLASNTDSGTLDRVFGPAAHATADDIDVLAPAMSYLIVEALKVTGRRRAARGGSRIIHEHPEVVA